MSSRTLGYGADLRDFMSFDNRFWECVWDELHDFDMEWKTDHEETDDYFWEDMNKEFVSLLNDRYDDNGYTIKEHMIEFFWERVEYYKEHLVGFYDDDSDSDSESEDEEDRFRRFINSLPSDSDSEEVWEDDRVIEEAPPTYEESEETNKCEIEYKSVEKPKTSYMYKGKKYKVIKKPGRVMNQGELNAIMNGKCGVGNWNKEHFYSGRPVY
jgi:hypothetical protein